VFNRATIDDNLQVMIAGDLGSAKVMQRLYKNGRFELT
jgi:hypothetical protein